MLNRLPAAVTAETAHVGSSGVLFVRIVLLQHFTITVTNELVKLGDFDLTEQGMLVSRLQSAPAACE
jgi:hypothetical protein